MSRTHTARVAERTDGLHRIIVVDDHPLMRAGLRVFLEDLPGWRLVGEASTAREALAQAGQLLPDLVLMDIAMPGMDGVIATRELLRRSPSSRVLAVTACLNVRDARDVLTAGACGYVLKSDSDALETALDAAARGERYLSPEIAERLASEELNTA